MFEIKIVLTADAELLRAVTAIATALTSGVGQKPASDGGSQPDTKEQAKEIVKGAASVAKAGKVKEEKKPEEDEKKEDKKDEVKITPEAIREAVQKKAQEGKKDDIKALLSAFGAPNVSKLAENDYGKFMKGLGMIDDKEAFSAFLVDLNIPF